MFRRLLGARRGCRKTKKKAMGRDVMSLGLGEKRRGVKGKGESLAGEGGMEVKWGNEAAGAPVGRHQRWEASEKTDLISGTIRSVEA